MMSIGTAAGAVVVLLGFTMAISYKKLRKMYEGYQISVDDNGVELKAPLAAYKRIAWNEIAYVEKPNGDIKIYNNTIAALSRWWSGTGVILIPREIKNKEQLLLSLANHSGVE